MRDYFRNRQVLGSIRQLDVVAGNVIIIDDFNSYTNGNLNGQGGWSGHTSFQVQGTTVVEGSKAISCASGTNDILISKTITPRTKGIFSFYMRRDWTGVWNMPMELKEGASRKCLLFIDTSVNTAKFAVDGQGTENIGTASYGTFYKFEIEIDQVNSKIRGRMNDGTWSNWLTSSFTKIDTIQFGKSSNGDTANAYFDYITFSEN